MKNLKILLFLTFTLLWGCDTGSVKNDAKIEFKQTEHNYGELELNGDGSCSFHFSNNGKSPLIIHNIKTSCGCTVPQWTQKPVPPGKSGEIQIEYDTSHPGTFSKTITVFYNGEDSPQVLTIRGSVKYPEIENL